MALKLRTTPFLLSTLAVALALALLSGCDTATPEGEQKPPPQEEVPEEVTSLRSSPVPPGARLLPRLGQGDQGLDGDLGVARAEATYPEEASPYGCSFSTLRSSAKATSGSGRYRYGGVYLHFPEALLEQAARTLPEAEAGRVETTTLQMISRRAPAHAQALPEGDGYGVVRMAHCRIPAAAANSEARSRIRHLVQKHLEQFSEEKSWFGEASERSSLGAVEYGRASSIASGGACVERTHFYTCGDPSSDVRDRSNYTKEDFDNDSRCTHDGSECTKYIITIDPLDDDGGGDSGDDPNECLGGGDDTATSDLIDQTCGDPIGTGSDGGEELDECDRNGDGAIFGPEEEACAGVQDLSLADDYAAGTDTTRFDCDREPVSKYEAAWCASSPPEGEDLKLTNDTLDELEQRGGECADIAQRGRELLQQGLLRYYPDRVIDSIRN